MLAYKLKESTPYIDKDRLFYPIDTQLLLIATPSKPQQFIDKYTLTHLQREGKIEEIDLLQEKTIHPHLYKPIKEQVAKELTFH